MLRKLVPLLDKFLLGCLLLRNGDFLGDVLRKVFFGAFRQSYAATIRESLQSINLFGVPGCDQSLLQNFLLRWCSECTLSTCSEARRSLPIVNPSLPSGQETVHDSKLTLEA